MIEHMHEILKPNPPLSDEQEEMLDWAAAMRNR